MESVFNEIKNISTFSILLFLIYVLIRVIALWLDGKKSIYDVFVEKQKDIQDSDFSMFIEREKKSFSDINKELDIIKAEKKTLKIAKEIEQRGNSSGFLAFVTNALASPERDRFERVNSVFNKILEVYEKSLSLLSEQENNREEIRKWALKDMQIINDIIECFSNQIVEYEEKIISDGSVTITSSFQGEKWVNSIRSFEPETSGMGVSMISLSQSYGGIAGAGMMIAGAVVALGEMIDSKNQKEAQYAKATEKRLDDIKLVLKEVKKIKAYSNQLHEISRSLNQCHEVFTSQISVIFDEIDGLPGINKKRTKGDPYPVVVSEDTLIKLMKIIEVYDAINRIVMEEN